MADKKPEMKPERSDTYYLKEVLQMAVSARFGMIFLMVVVLVLLFFLFYMISKPAYTVVIDRTTGQTFVPVGVDKGVTQELLKRQLVFYTVQMVEYYANYDHNTIVDARKKVYEMASSQFRGELGDKFWDDDDVKKCIDRKAEYYITWEMQPRVTQANDPYYTLFGTFQRVIKYGGLTQELKRYNVRVDWGRLNDNVDYAKRPHALVLLNIKYLNELGEINDQMNRLK